MSGLRASCQWHHIAILPLHTSIYCEHGHACRESAISKACPILEPALWQWHHLQQFYIHLQNCQLGGVYQSLEPEPALYISLVSLTKVLHLHVGLSGISFRTSFVPATSPGAGLHVGVVFPKPVSFTFRTSWSENSTPMLTNQSYRLERQFCGICPGIGPPGTPNVPHTNCRPHFIRDGST